MTTEPVPCPPETFAVKFCRHFDVPAGRFDRELLQRSLYPHARWMSTLGDNELLAVDRAFVRHVASLTRRRDLAGEVVEFQHDPRNRTFWRRHGRLRVSIRRMQKIFHAVWGPAAEPPAGEITPRRGRGYVPAIE